VVFPKDFLLLWEKVWPYSSNTQKRKKYIIRIKGDLKDAGSKYPADQVRSALNYWQDAVGFKI